MSHTRPRVILVANDVVPGCGLPVAAPGLRVFGLASGLAARGHPVSTVVVRGPLDRQWRGPIPVPMPRDTVALAAADLSRYLYAQAPATVVLTNANQVDHLPPPPDGNRYVVDFFAPKLLELVYEVGDGPYPVAELDAHRRRKLRGITRADGFIVNGAKKLPYFLAWILQTERDVRALPIELVGMCLPAAFEPVGTDRPAGPTRLAMAGYLQGWSVPGPWLRALEPYLEARECTLDAMLPEHWGGASGFANPELDALVQTGALRVHAAMPFADFQRFLAGCDAVVDLFGRTRERELAVVTRTIVALASGKPVLHPPFTEVSPLIEEFGAGWLVDPEDGEALKRTLTEIVTDREAVAERSRGARRLWAAQLDPAVAVKGLERVIEQIQGPSSVSGHEQRTAAV